MKKRAIISVFDKTGIVDFAKALQQQYDYEIVSTGSTAKLLKDNGIETIEVSKLTGCEEMLTGKVKTRVFLRMFKIYTRQKKSQIKIFRRFKWLL